MQVDQLYASLGLEPMTLNQMAMLAGYDTVERRMLMLANMADKRKNPTICLKIDTILTDLKRHRLLHLEILEFAQIDDDAMDEEDNADFDLKMKEIALCREEIDGKVTALAKLMIQHG